MSRADVKKAVDAARWAFHWLANPPSHPGHTCTPGVTDCDCTCVEWAHFCHELADVQRDLAELEHKYGLQTNQDSSRGDVDLSPHISKETDKEESDWEAAHAWSEDS